MLLACLFVAALIAAVYLWMVFISGRGHSSRPSPPPMLIVPVHRASETSPRPLRRADFAHANGGQPHSNGRPSHLPTEDFAPRERFAPALDSTVTPPSAVPTYRPAPPRAVPRLEHIAPLESETVRFTRPGEQALQLLPAHLEVEEGDGRGEIIRLLCAFGENPEITLGRGDGEAHRHVKLHSPTVSRMHARLMLHDGQWRILNLSLTNPLLVNGERVPDVGEGRILTDGDRVEIGALALRFHER